MHFIVGSAQHSAHLTKIIIVNIYCNHSRNHSPEGTKRQIVAVAVTGDLRPYIQQINVPTLVIHGSIDPLFPLAAGQDIADNIPNAKLEVVEGMGHETPPMINPLIAKLILEHLNQ